MCIRSKKIQIIGEGGGNLHKVGMTKCQASTILNETRHSVIAVGGRLPAIFVRPGKQMIGRAANLFIPVSFD